LKHLIFTSILIFCSSLIFSQGLDVNNVKEGNGDEPPPGSEAGSAGDPLCTDCFTFDLVFTVSAEIESDILEDITLEYNAPTGDINGFSPDAWIIEEIHTSTECTIYSYTQELSICFDIDSTLCPPGVISREELVTFQLNVNGECLGDFLYEDSSQNYFDEICFETIEIDCSISYLFENICCQEPKTTEGRSNASNLIKSSIVSPTPFYNNLTIQHLNKGDELFIYSSMGETIFSKRVSKESTCEHNIQLDNIPAGVYILHIFREGKILTKTKLLKH